jgi:hypothetical protein
VVSAGPYILGILALAAVVLSLGFSAVRLRQRLIPTWEGAPAHLVETIVAIALLIWLSELLGVLSLFYAWTLVVSSLLVAGTLAWRLQPSTAMAPPAGGVGGGGSRTPPPAAPPTSGDRTPGP